jgi:mono/diheme cytochrome c family protein
MTVHTPIESRESGIPAWAIGITVFVLLVGGVYLASNLSGENPPFAVPGSTPLAPVGSAGADPVLGAALIEQVTPPCTACHGEDLTGGVGPDLHNVADGPTSENLQDLYAAHPDDWINFWIDGTTPETEGIERGGMPMFGEQLDPHEIDSIVAYLRGL